MSTESATSQSYSTGTQLMHWASGGCMVASVALVLQAQNTPKEQMDQKMELMKYHKVRLFSLLVSGLLLM